MVVCDSEGIVYDLWFHPASYHEVRSLRIRYRKSKWLRFLVDRFGLMGDRGYRGCEYVEVCEGKEQKGIRQVEERYYLTCLPLWLRYRLVAFSESLKYGSNFSSDVWSFILNYFLCLKSF
jgi:hypothetical protein